MIVVRLPTSDEEKMEKGTWKKDASTGRVTPVTCPEKEQLPTLNIYDFVTSTSDYMLYPIKLFVITAHTS